LDRWAEDELIENFKSPSDGKLYTAKRRLRFETFPKYLLCQSRRFTIGDNWQPKKLNVSLDFPDTLDLSDMRATGEQAGEQMMETDSNPAPSIDENLVNQLVEMGYPYHASRKALYHTSQQLEAALEWLMTHVGDLDFDSPLVVDQSGASKPTFPPESIIMVTSMGFTEIQAQNALEATSGNVEMAIDWIFTNPELSLQPSETKKPSESKQMTSSEGSKSPKYELVAFVSHMGTSTSCGHYVAHVKNQSKETDQSDWIIFNDNKVAFSKSPPRDLAYPYFYRQI